MNYLLHVYRSLALCMRPWQLTTGPVKGQFIYAIDNYGIPVLWRCGIYCHLLCWEVC